MSPDQKKSKAIRHVLVHGRASKVKGLADDLKALASQHQHLLLPSTLRLPEGLSSRSILLF